MQYGTVSSDWYHTVPKYIQSFTSQVHGRQRQDWRFHLYNKYLSKVDKGKFKIEGGEIKVIVKSRVVDKSEFKDDGSKCKIIMKRRVMDKS